MWLSYVSVLLSLPYLLLSLYRLRIARMIADTPTSSVRSAAQGFVELKGKAFRPQDSTLFVPVLQRPCAWFRHEAYEQAEANDRLVAVRESHQRFFLNDGTGLCAIDPGKADILPKRYESRREGNTLHKLSWIGNNDYIYVMGWLHTLHPRPKVNDVISKTRQGANSQQERRYGHLKEEMHRVGEAPFPGIPFLVGTHGERIVITRIRKQALLWFLAFLAFVFVLPLLIEIYASTN